MNIIPSPKKYVETGKTVDLSGAVIAVSHEFDIRVMHAASRLCLKLNEFAEKKCYAKLGTGGTVNVIKADTGDAYTVSVSENQITITGGDSGAFYGLQTVMQMITLSSSSVITTCEIDDKPDYSIRGFYHDVTRGRIPTLDTLKEIVDTISMYKVNHFQLYIEDSFAFAELEGVMGKDEVLYPEEIIELDNYCHDRFVEFVPSVASFGHLYNQLQCERFKHCCEYENYEPHQHYWLEKMSHHTVDVSSDEAFNMICSRIDQYAMLFRSDKFNICCDETYDLCKGKNKGKNTGEEYFKFVLKLVNHLKAMGKSVMMWGDIVVEHPEKLSLLPDDTIMLNWCYSKEPIEENVKLFSQSGKNQYVCPCTNSWNRFVEEIGISHDNISKMAYYGHKYGAVGFLNTNWGDYGNVPSLGCERYGIVLGCERAWNASVNELSRGWYSSFAKIEFFPDRALCDCPDIFALIRDASSCEENNRWMEFVPWFSANYIENRNIKIYEIDENNCRNNIIRLLKILETIRSFGDTNANMRDLRLGVEAVIMMNRFNLHFGGFEKECVRCDGWLSEYSDAWLARCKPSQLYVLQNFLKLVFSK